MEQWRVKLNRARAELRELGRRNTRALTPCVRGDARHAYTASGECWRCGDHRDGAPAGA